MNVSLSDVHRRIDSLISVPLACGSNDKQISAGKDPGVRNLVQALHLKNIFEAAHEKMVEFFGMPDVDYTYLTFIE